jgi:hypothetical protein
MPRNHDQLTNGLKEIQEAIDVLFTADELMPEGL